MRGKASIVAVAEGSDRGRAEVCSFGVGTLVEGEAGLGVAIGRSGGARGFEEGDCVVVAERKG